MRAVAAEIFRFGGGVKAPDRLGGVDHTGVALAHQNLCDDGGGGTLDSLAAEQFEQDPLDHVPHAALRIGNAGVEGQPGDAPLAFLRADQNVADLRSVAVGDDDAGVALEKGDQVAQGLGCVFELLGDGARLSGARDRIAT